MKKIPRLIITGTNSNVGKTVISCAIIYGLQKRGYSVQPFKAGPDYIDAGYLSAISGRQACNLDVWLMGKNNTLDSLAKNSTSDISIIEGVMGFYDGIDGSKNLASTYQLHRITKSPVILVVDVSGVGRSVAATVLGFMQFNKKTQISGIILNRVGSERHKRICTDAIKSLNIQVLGAIPKNIIQLKSRHLGLIPVMEGNKNKDIEKISHTIHDYIDMDKIIKISKSAPTIHLQKSSKKRDSRTTIGIALDGSFNFYYKDNLEKLKNNGAKLEFFSPETSKRMPDINGLYIGGGFPEVRGAILEKNYTLINEIKKAILNGIPTYAECGGLIYLGKTLQYDNKQYDMVGAVDAHTYMTKRPTLNYTKGVMYDNILNKKTIKFHGHEFHYSKMDVSEDSRFAQRLYRGEGILDNKDGILVHDTMASYGHLYFSDKMAKNIVECCAKFSRV